MNDQLPRMSGDQIRQVLAAVEQRKHSDVPYPDCFVCGAPVAGQITGPWVGGDGEALRTVRPCGHRMTYNTEAVEQIRRQMATEETRGQDPETELASLRREVAAARKFAADMRDFCSPHGVATGYADRLIEAMDRAKGERRDVVADILAAEWHRRHQRLEDLAKAPGASATVVEHVRGELIGLRGALGVLLGGQVEGGTADLLGWSYYQEWRQRQEARS